MTQQRKRILVIAPHADDEVLGCGGYLLHQKQEGADITIVVGTIGGIAPHQDKETRLAEFNAVCDILGAQRTVLFFGKDALMDTIPSYDIISQIDKIVDAFRPDEIFINYRSHHQDHMKMYDCALASCRGREGYSPKTVVLYEYPFIISKMESVGGGNMFHDITDCIDEKVGLFMLYGSQVRKAPSPLNEDGIRQLAKLRGMECGTEYAEKFYIQKMVR